MAKKSEPNQSWWAESGVPVLVASEAVLVVGTSLARLMNARKSTPAQNDQHDKHPISEPVGHVATDLMGDHHPGPKDRAIDAFRPDMSAPVPPEEREAYRPVTLKVKRHFGTHQLRMRA